MLQSSRNTRVTNFLGKIQETRINRLRMMERYQLNAFDFITKTPFTNLISLCWKGKGGRFWKEEIVEEEPGPKLALSPSLYPITNYPAAGIHNEYQTRFSGK